MLKFNLIEIIKMGIAAFVTKSILNNRFAPLFWKRLAGYKGYELSSDRKTLILECANALVSVSVFRKNVFRIIVKFNTTKKIPFYDGEYFTFSVESQPISVLEVSETDLNLSISTESESSAIFDKESCCFLLSQKSSCGKENGPERITNVEFSAGRKSWVRIVTQTKQKVSFMGFGQKTRGFFKNHHKMRMWNTDDALLNPKSDPAYQSWPVVLSGNSCGFDGWFFDNPHYQKFKTNTGSRVSRLYASAERGPGCLYWTGGQDPAVVSNNFGCLMGTYRLPPLWVLGHHHSRWEPEESSNRIIGIMKNFRLRKIPCDAVHIDIAHMRGLRCFTWDRSSFPDLEEFIAELHIKNFRIVVIIDPGLKKDDDWDIYRDGKEKNLFCRDLDNNITHGKVWPGESAFPDFSDPDARTWWGHLFKIHTDLGIDGFWIDMNEPSVFNARLTLANNVLHRVGEKKQIRDHCTIHNLYALLMARATAEGLRKLRAGMRQFVFSRAAYAGMQRWASTWTGDNRSNWGHLRLSIPMILNLGMSGMPMTGPDIGGFWDAPTKELLARWFAAGVLYPFHRNHTQNGSPPQEIWSFGPEIEEICARFIRMRYAFIPYLYALFFVAWKNGWPIMRPLVFHFPMDPKCYEDMFADTEYMAGDSVLVAPILWQGKSERCIYLPCEKNNDDINPASIPGLVIKPALVEWVCHRTHRIFSGGMKITEKVPLDEVPLFVRRGSVLPMSPGIMTTAQAFSQEIVLDVYPAKTLDGVIYLDDNQTEEYQDGKYSLFKISGKTDDKSMELQVRRAEGSLSPAWARINTIIVRIACYGQKHDMRQIKVDGKLLSDQAFLIKDDWLCFKFSDFGPDLKIEADWS